MNNPYTTATQAALERAKIDQKIAEMQAKLAQQQALDEYKAAMQQSQTQLGTAPYHQHQTSGTPLTAEQMQKMYEQLVGTDSTTPAPPKPIKGLKNMLEKIL